MYDQGILRQVLWELAAAGELKEKFPAAVLFNPARQLDRADILALPVVRTALGDQNRVAVFQLVQIMGAVNRCICLLYTSRNQ